jgi:hypothetical protein
MESARSSTENRPSRMAVVISAAPLVPNTSWAMERASVSEEAFAMTVVIPKF